ncbi:MAG: hypothetical protein ABIR62_13265 [Dokdonella sp.]|uniref:hypothetical protein n=1 Tax=Dokdonella sp. TaxID=2291710 RepID=UPI003266DEE1
MNLDTVRPKPRNLAVALALSCLLCTLFGDAQASQIDLPGPPGTTNFGRVKALPNGNIVVIAEYTPPGTQDSLGAVFLYRSSGSLISVLTGYGIGSGSLQVVRDSDFVVCSPRWSNSSATHDMGAATWVDGNIGLDGMVSANNSIVGAHDSDSVCVGGVTALTNGDYVISSPNWGSDVTHPIGAATHCARGGCVGTVNASNSLTGNADGDEVGLGVIALSNGNYVVASPWWSNSTTRYVGAVTLCSDGNGCTGAVTEANSLTGSTDYDLLGQFGDGNDAAGVIPLSGGDFVVKDQNWHDERGVPVGSATHVSGTSGLVGRVSTQNSLVGTNDGDFAQSRITALTNGNYVVHTPYRDAGALADVGASTWCDGKAGCVGPLSEAISLQGSIANDRVGWGPQSGALTDGNYVVTSPYWSKDGISKVGAATWCSGVTGCSGPVSALNSLVGGAPYDIVGSAGVTPLPNGRYVVSSPYWANGTVARVGAATWCDAGGDACVAPVSRANSLTGSAENDLVGNWQATALTNGNYVVYSGQWNLDGARVGAVTWGSGAYGSVGRVSTDNSFTGITTDESQGFPRMTAVANGNYVITSPSRSNGVIWNAGAVTFLRGFGPQNGSIDRSNSVIGQVEGEGASLSFDYDAISDVLVVGKPAENVVTLLKLDELFFADFD